MQISLCIPTMRRWDFLKISLPKYLENKHIYEIIITDETGEDFELINENFKNEEKIKIFKNEKRLGPFLNKLECMKKATLEWICLIDSDNFADLDYFDSFFNFEKSPNPTIIYCPSKAAPNFDYSSLENNIIFKSNIKDLFNSTKRQLFETCMNTGNYILHKNNIEIVETSLLNEEYNSIAKLFQPYDVIFMNYLFFKRDQGFMIVPNMTYSHVVHSGSIWVTTHAQFPTIYPFIQKLFENIV